MDLLAQGFVNNTTLDNECPLSFSLTVELTGGTTEQFKFARNLVKTRFPSAFFYESTENKYEYNGIHRVWDIGQKGCERDFVLYLHDKGVTHGSHLEPHILRLFDELVLDPFHILRTFRANPNAEVVAISIGPGAFPWENFYWARISFIRTLPEPVVTTNRYYYEGWAGRFGACYGWTDQCSPGGYTDRYGRVRFDELSADPRISCAGSRPQGCIAYDPQRLASMFSIVDNSTGVARCAGKTMG